MATELATLAGGCFWGVEHFLSKLNGVLDAKSGYTGGNLSNPSYKQVCYGNTGHTEAVQVKFDPTVIPYSTLLVKFLELIDPTTLNRQGPDVGTNYRSAVFYHSEQQKTTAEKVFEDYQKRLNTEKKLKGFGKKMVIALEKSKEFWDAEEYHQKYFEKHGIDPTCHM